MVTLAQSVSNMLAGTTILYSSLLSVDDVPVIQSLALNYPVHEQLPNIYRIVHTSHSAEEPLLEPSKPNPFGAKELPIGDILIRYYI